jgi:hypothetical protein
MDDKLAAVLAEMIKSLLNGDNEYPEEANMIARAVQLGIDRNELDIIGSLVFPEQTDEGQPYRCEEINGKRVFSKKEQILLGKDKINTLLYLNNHGIISGAELDAILVFAEGLATDPREEDYLMKALNIVLTDKVRADFLTGVIEGAKELVN